VRRSLAHGVGRLLALSRVELALHGWSTIHEDIIALTLPSSNCGMFYRPGLAAREESPDRLVAEIMEAVEVTDNTADPTPGGGHVYSSVEADKVPGPRGPNTMDIQQFKWIDTRESTDPKLWLERVESLFSLIWSLEGAILARSTDTLETTSVLMANLKTLEAGFLERGSKLKSQLDLARLPPSHMYFRECSRALKQLKTYISNLQALEYLGSSVSRTQSQHIEATTTATLLGLANMLQHLNSALDYVSIDIQKALAIQRTSGDANYDTIRADKNSDVQVAHIRVTSDKIPGDVDIDPSMYLITIQCGLINTNANGMAKVTLFRNYPAGFSVPEEYFLYFGRSQKAPGASETNIPTSDLEKTLTLLSAISSSSRKRPALAGAC
jgi:hypothetical protein